MSFFHLPPQVAFEGEVADIVGGTAPSGGVAAAEVAELRARAAEARAGAATAFSRARLWPFAASASRCQLEAHATALYAALPLPEVCWAPSRTHTATFCQLPYAVMLRRLRGSGPLEFRRFVPRPPVSFPRFLQSQESLTGELEGTLARLVAGLEASAAAAGFATPAVDGKAAARGKAGAPRAGAPELVNAVEALTDKAQLLLARLCARNVELDGARAQQQADLADQVREHAWVRV